jgi:replicative superfamily II helicase
VLTSGDVDSDDSYLARYDIIITTSEKLDSLLRPSCTVVVECEDADSRRNPSLERCWSWTDARSPHHLMRMILPQLQLIGLSAPIGNPEDLLIGSMLP